MRHQSFASLLSILLLFPVGTIRPQSLEIHQISVGQGDAAVIIQRNVAHLKTLVHATIPGVRDVDLLHYALDSNMNLGGTVDRAVLIDLGPKGQGATIRNYCQRMGVMRYDYILISHYHEDHIAGADVLIPVPVPAAPSPTVLYDRGNTRIKSLVYSTYMGKANSLGTNRKTADTTTHFAFPSTVTAPLLPAIVFQCIAANAKVLGPSSVRLPIRNENDWGVAWLLTYGTFRYYTGGDLGGLKNSQYVDVETPMIEGVQTSTGSGHVCAMKINHHGSPNSSNPGFLATCSPSMCVTSYGKPNKYPNLPSTTTLGRIHTACRQQDFNTNQGENIILIVADSSVIPPTLPGLPHSRFVVLKYQPLRGPIISRSIECP